MHRRQKYSTTQSSDRTFFSIVQSRAALNHVQGFALRGWRKNSIDQLQISVVEIPAGDSGVFANVVDGFSLWNCEYAVVAGHKIQGDLSRCSSVFGGDC